ncbi:hypothetical protein Tco_0806261 [Tanacetum coccineum]
MDNRIGVATTTLPRWDVMEDTKALYIIRDMSGLPNKDFVGVPSRMCFLHRIQSTVVVRDMVEIDVKDEVLKVVIPKKRGKWTRNIMMNAELYCHQNKGSKIVYALWFDFRRI